MSNQKRKFYNIFSMLVAMATMPFVTPVFAGNSSFPDRVTIIMAQGEDVMTQFNISTCTKQFTVPSINNPAPGNTYSWNVTVSRYLRTTGDKTTTGPAVRAELEKFTRIGNSEYYMSPSVTRIVKGQAAHNGKYTDELLKMSCN